MARAMKEGVVEDMVKTGQVDQVGEAKWMACVYLFGGIEGRCEIFLR